MSFLHCSMFVDYCLNDSLLLKDSVCVKMYIFLCRFCFGKDLRRECPYAVNLVVLE